MIEMSAMVIEDGDVTLCLFGLRYRSGPLAGLAQVQEPGGADGEARGRGGLGALIPSRAGSARSSIF
jgi:hypothetical protein